MSSEPVEPLASLGEKFSLRRTGFFPWVNGLRGCRGFDFLRREFDIPDSRCSRFGGHGGSLFFRN